MKILTIRTDWGAPEERKKQNAYGGVGYYRSIKPTEVIAQKYDVTNWGRETGEIADTAEKQWTKIFTDYDVLWTTHLFSKDALGWMLFGANHFKKKLIIDIDDDFLHVEKTHYMYDRFKSGSADKTILSTALSLADAITVSTYPLKEMCEKHFYDVHGIKKKVYVIPNMNDIADWPEKTAPKEEGLTIGYSGSMSHNADFALVIGQLMRLMKKYKHVKLKILGTVAPHDVPTLFKAFPPALLDRVEVFGGTATFREYPVWLSKQDWDIGIAPLTDCEFNKKKSHIKWMEYAMYEIPTVASRIYPYYMQFDDRDTIIDGETGMLASTPKEFGDKIEELINNAQLRKRIGKQAREYVVKNWQYKDGPILERFEKMLSEI
jgi:glycosyltransferase involved in cell wall biosynthesis